MDEDGEAFEMIGELYVANRRLVQTVRERDSVILELRGSLVRLEEQLQELQTGVKNEG